MLLYNTCHWEAIPAIAQLQKKHNLGKCSMLLVHDRINGILQGVYFTLKVHQIKACMQY